MSLQVLAIGSDTKQTRDFSMCRVPARTKFAITCPWAVLDVITAALLLFFRVAFKGVAEDVEKEEAQEESEEQDMEP